jgi:hypothetical protein
MLDGLELTSPNRSRAGLAWPGPFTSKANVPSNAKIGHWRGQPLHQAFNEDHGSLYFSLFEVFNGSGLFVTLAQLLSGFL